MDERETARRVWHAPELTVLVRGRQEEAVLQACKFSPYQAAANLGYTVCQVPNSGCVGCTDYVAS